jgi:hypothetical protein
MEKNFSFKTFFILTKVDFYFCVFNKKIFKKTKKKRKTLKNIIKKIFMCI